ncbi:7TM diverse intracellular signaling domain-containing protein, partial [Parasphingorhabdus sp.]|uniref:7TM diverse intracellular signaling domain-containing protein n=1 Tax=Parasphingorhabdus sp. TaxID=2709688 RepID=UPI0032635AF3
MIFNKGGMAIRYSIKFLIFVIALLCAFQMASAAQLESGLEFEFMSVPAEDSITIDALCCAAEPVNWEKARSVTTSINNPVIWIKLPSILSGEIFEFPQMVDKIELFERAHGSEHWTISTTGDTIPVSKRAMQTAEMALKLSTDPTQKAERYIRLEQPSSVSHSIDVWEESAFIQSAELRFHVQLLLFGFCGAMIAFNLVVALVTRTKLFAFNAGTISSTMLIAIYMNGQGGFLLWPESPDISFFMLVLGMGTLSLFATQLVSAFLENGSIRSSWLRANRWFGVAQLLIALAVILSGSQSIYAGLLLIGLLSMGLQLFLVFTSIGKGDRQSIPILVPLSILIAGICFRWARTAFSMDFGWANYHIMEIAMALEAITFSLILAARIRYFASLAARAETKLSEVKLEAANRFARLQDAERERIASDLHDSLGHSLAMVNAQLGKAEASKQPIEDITDRVTHSRLALRDAIAQTRRISHDLYPSKLDHLGLKDSLQEMTNELSSAYDIKTDTVLDFPENILSADDKLQIYRITQEAISNVIKHSGAGACTLAIHWAKDLLTFKFSDDGIGMPEDTQGGLGLLSISQRILLIGGEAGFTSNPAGGLVVEFSILRPNK